MHSFDCKSLPLLMLYWKNTNRKYRKLPQNPCELQYQASMAGSDQLLITCPILQSEASRDIIKRTMLYVFQKISHPQSHKSSLRNSHKCAQKIRG